jgi:hypothetical protein
MLLPAVVLTLGLLPLQTPPPGQRSPATSPKPKVNPNAATIQEFVKRVNWYVELHTKLEGTLPTLPKQTTPQQIDHHERALAALIQQERKAAKQGDIFFPGMQRLVRQLLRPVFAGQGGVQIRAEILDNEYKGDLVLAPNGRYPDEIPVSTVPPQVLQNLPKLPEELEYRFVRQNMILFDPHAHLIADWVPQAFK